MMRSLSSAVAGLRTHQTKMDVIGNNIANVNTNGFKASRTTFADVYYQNLSSGNRGATGTRGGTNPTQIGYGSAVATIDVMQSIAGKASTNSPLDVYISGEGFLVSKDQSGQVFYSRLGNLDFDEAGNLVDGNGNRIMGFPMNPDGTPNIPANGIATADSLQGIWLDPKLFDKIKSLTISKSGAITGLLDGDQQVTVDTSVIPDWLNGNSVSIPATSTYKGTINVAISGFCDKDYLATVLRVPPGSILNMEMGNLPLPANGDYKITIDRNNNVTITNTGNPPAIPAVNLKGSLKDNKLVLTDSNDNVGLSIEFKPDTTLPTTITKETASQTLNVSTTEGDGRVKWVNENGEPLDVYGEPVSVSNRPQAYIMPATPGSVAETADSPTLYDLNSPATYKQIEIGGAPQYYDTTTWDKTGAHVNDPGWFLCVDANGDPLDPDGDGTKYYAQLTGDDTSGYPAAYEPDTYNPLPRKGAFLTTMEHDPIPLTLDLYSQMITTDKGGNVVKEPATPEKFDPNFTGKINFGELSFIITSKVDPNKPLNGIIGVAEPGESIVVNIGNLVLAKFRNAAGLDQTGTSYFMESLNSGEPVLVVPGNEGTGGLISNSLEMSNVDISQEFTDMITTQRGFQANSRIITVSDEMLQELVNLKR